MSNILPYYPLGVATLTGTPQSLTTLYPQLVNIHGNSLYAIIVQTHESNDDATLVYVGSGELQVDGSKALVLQGPLQSGTMANENSLNTFDPDNIFLMSNPADQQVRVAVFAS